MKIDTSTAYRLNVKTACHSVRVITDCRSKEAVSADTITDTYLFEAFFLTCRIIYIVMLQSGFLQTFFTKFL